MSALWQRLHEAGLVQGEPPAPVVDQSPWFVRTMLAVAGWIGALFLLGFVGLGLTFVVQSKAASIAVGALACVGAYAVFRAAPDNDFANQFGLATSLAGQGLLTYGVGSCFSTVTAVPAYIIGAFEVVLVAAVPNFTHRVLCTLAVLVALWYGFAMQGISALLPGLVAGAYAVVWLHEFAWARRGSLWRAIGYGVALGMVLCTLTMMWGPRNMFGMRYNDVFWMMQHAPSLSTILVAIAFMYAVWQLLARAGVAASSRSGQVVMVAAVLVMLVSYPAPGVAAALLIMLLGFANGNRVLLGLGGITFGAYLSGYYYQMHATLLEKALVLALTGVALLAIRLALQRWLGPGNTEAAHA